MRGKYREAERYFREAYKWSKVYPQASVTVADNITEFAVNQTQQGQLEEAKALFSEALAMREALLSPNHPDIARTVGNIADIEFRQGHFTTALSLLRRATKILAARDKYDDRASLQLLRHIRAAWTVSQSTKDQAEVLHE